MAKKKVKTIVEEVKTPMNRTEFIHIVSVKTSEFLDRWKDTLRNSTSRREVVQLRREFSGLKSDYMKSFDDEERAAEILNEMDGMIDKLKGMIE